MAFLDDVKLAMGITTTVMDNEIQRLILAGFRDLQFADVNADADTVDPAIKQAVITYCRLNFDSPDDYDRLAKSYEMQKAQLQTAHLV